MSLITVFVFAPLLILASTLVLGTIVLVDLRDQARSRAPRRLAAPAVRRDALELTRAA